MFRTSRFLSTLPKIRLRESTLELSLPEKVEFHYQWLRDNCRCPKCIHPPTQQKLHSSGQILAQKPLNARYINEKQVEIKWPGSMLKGGNDGGHTSLYDVSFLKRFHYNQPFRPLIQPVLWNAQAFREARQTVDYSDFSTSTGYQTVLKQLRDYGLCFMKNVPTENEKQVESVAETFGVIKVRDVH
jgi:gamma-butyrobetaine dioxygenase